MKTEGLKTMLIAALVIICGLLAAALFKKQPVPGIPVPQVIYVTNQVVMPESSKPRETPIQETNSVAPSVAPATNRIASPRIPPVSPANPYTNGFGPGQRTANIEQDLPYYVSKPTWIISERSRRSWTFSWRLAVRNLTREEIDVGFQLEFVDAWGYLMQSTYVSYPHLKPLDTQPISGLTKINNPGALRVVNVRVKATR